ncbi:transmembrane protein 33-like [Ylistrum balloti]|uniref:transmembrane protein 33-like n=1 Tax=Ylistrum balloti TaxID=509963 RepID=UPI002905DEA4|nr:transmembrane protein 33-like [Ylistrum balloti]
MAENGSGDGLYTNSDNQTPPTPPPPPQSVMGFMLSNKVEAGLWLTRLFTVICTFFFFIPVIGSGPHGFYQRALISNAATSALRLHQRIPNVQLNMAFLKTIMMEDSGHYLFFSLIFLNSYPITMALMPVFLYALLHACNYTKAVLNIMGPTFLQFVRNLIQKLQSQQVSVLRFVACTEIFIMPTIVFMMLSGRCSLFLPIIYYRFLILRYSSRRNPYCRTLFSEMRMTVEYLTNKPQCPGIVRTLCNKSIALIYRLAPQM